MSAANSDTSNNTNNTPTFLAALITGCVVSAVYLSLFFILHKKSQKVYQPRSFLGPQSRRARMLPAGFFAWFMAIVREPDIHVRDINGLDGYFFVRFMRFMIILLVPTWFLTWVVLFPVSAVSPNVGLKGLSMFSFGNVSVQTRQLAHFFIAIVVILYTLFLLHREFVHFAKIRGAYLASPEYAALACSRSVMLTNVPATWQSDSALQEQAAFAGSVERVWRPRNVKPLEKLFDARDKEVMALEGGEAKLQTLAAKNVRKQKLPPGGAESADPILRYIPAKKRPSHRLGLLGLIGKKVDTLDYSPTFIRTKTEELDAAREDMNQYPLVNSAFVRFGSATEAHTFARDLRGNAKSRTVSVAVDVMPEDVIWPNLSMSPTMRNVRTAVSWALTIGLIIIWAPLVAFVGLVSNISTICSSVSFLQWICKLPTAVKGIIQGILPPVALAVLFMLLPIVLRIFIKLQGEPRHSTVALKLWTRFWLFQIINGFLIVGAASGAISAISGIITNAGQNLPRLPTDLANNLPNSAIFFLTLILTSTLSSSTAALSRAVPFVLSKLEFIFRGSTPRKAYAYDHKMGAVTLATAWPPVALLAVIGTVYTVVQPIIIGFAALGFMLLYVTNKYMLVWVCDQPRELETNGMYYPRALGAVFAGLYVEEIFLAALFILEKRTVGYICGGIMIAILVLTALYQIWLERTFRPRYNFLAPGRESKHAHAASATAVNGDQALPHYGLTDGLHAHAFDHPAAWKAQRTVWLADDALGLGKGEAARLNALGVHATCEGASRGPAGRCEVVRGPVDEAGYDEKEEQ